jgi:hypothetical protein
MVIGYRILLTLCCSLLLGTVHAADEQKKPLSGDELAADVREFFSQTGFVMKALGEEVATWVTARYDALPAEQKARVRDFLLTMKQQYRVFSQEAASSGQSMLQALRRLADKIIVKFRQLEKDLQQDEKSGSPAKKGVVT